jgi:hypothetical protein
MHSKVAGGSSRSREELDADDDALRQFRVSER